MKKLTATLLLCLALPINSYAVGAIAVDDEAGDMNAGYGISTGLDSEQEAKAAAVKFCKEEGNHNCKPVVWFKTCGAYAANTKVYGIGYGASKEIASKMAKDACGADSCKIVVADCE